MSVSSQPSTHQARERQIVDHVRRLLDDSRFVVDTASGRRGTKAMAKSLREDDRAVDLKQTMARLDRPDRQLQAAMPLGLTLDAALQKRSWLLLKRTVGRVRVICWSPTEALVLGREPPPMPLEEARRLLAETARGSAKQPATVILASTSGFAPEVHDLVERTREQTLALASPNAAGGWTVRAPGETGVLSDLLNPEGEDDRRQRVRDVIASAKSDLSGAGLAADRVAQATQLPLGLIEDELRSFAKANPGLAAKRLDGRIVLFRESAAVTPGTSGASVMPIVDRIRSLFAGRGENEKKIAFLSERRAALMQQRDRLYEEIGELESKDAAMREQFRLAEAALAKRRITGQLLQLRKDQQRRQQMLQVLNQQINVVSTHLHNLELVQQGTAAKLPDSEQIAEDAAAAEEMLAQLQADHELVESIGGATAAGLSEEEAALFEELEREAAQAKPVAEPSPPAAAPAKPSREPGQRAAAPPRPAEPEAN